MDQMRHFHFIFLVIFFLSFSLRAQTLDTLVDVRGYKMHFNILKGEATPILFEAGAGSDGSVWNHILEKIYEVTGTTLITYDRSRFGQSELNPNLKNDSDLEIHKGDQVELISTTGFKNLIHISCFDTNVFAQLITQTTINPIAIKCRRLSV